MLRPPIKIIAFVIASFSFSGCKKEDRETAVPVDDRETSYPTDSAFGESKAPTRLGNGETAPGYPGEGNGDDGARKLNKRSVCALFLNHDSTTVTLNLADEDKQMLRPITLRPGYDAEIKTRAYYAWIDPQDVKIITCRNRYEIRDNSIYRLVANTSKG